VMNWYKVQLSLRSPTGTPWQADTIFGHLCWMLLHTSGEDALLKFLEPFRAGEPPLLISDGFPAGLLPRPLSFALPYGKDRDTFRAARKLRKIAYLTLDEFLRAIQGESLNPVEVLKYDEERPKSLSRVILKNQISRLTGTTGEGGQLFGFKEYWTPDVDIYLKIQNGWEGTVEELFQGLRRSGYGKRKSVGYGAIDRVSPLNGYEGFHITQEANAFVTLSHFTPSNTDPTDGRWRIRVKHGRLGEEFAARDNPFKRPLMMLQPGSVFYDTPVKEHYGRLVTGISVYPEVVQYGFALPVPMKLPLASSTGT
jgi:CRISPR-associated protein Csm4